MDELRYSELACGINSVNLAKTHILDENNQIRSENIVRTLGAVYTPSDFAQFLTSWAIQNSEDKVLDVGIGEGVFVFASYIRLRELGATTNNAEKQIFGAEIDTITYNKFIEETKKNNLNFSNLQNRNFFEVDFPPVEAIVGNPPYVRRTYIQNVDAIRNTVLKRNLSIEELNVTRMTDLYIYFLLQALPMLKPGGRLAVITSDPWLNVSYGEAFKMYLQKHFKIETLISLDKRVFNDAQVKPVLILATKKENVDFNWHVHFIRIKNGLPINRLHESLSNPNIKNTDITYSKVKSSDLKTFTPWSIHFKAPEVYEELEAHPLMTQMANVAKTRIGLQTLGKDFFVLPTDRAKANQIESDFLEPLAQSIRYVSKPTIDKDTKPTHYLFYCAESKEKLHGTNALEYILQGEAAEVEVRGKNTTMVGYNNKERIKRSGRKFWYDLKSSLERRGSASILIPRLVYRTFRVVWNRAAFVPGELFIEFLPQSEIAFEVYLAILNSSISEIMLRTHAQIYGGGTFNINPGQIKKVPILNVALLTTRQKEELKQAYLVYIVNPTYDRKNIDNIIYEILGLSYSKQKIMKEVLEDLLVIATSSSNKRNSTNA